MKRAANFPEFGRILAVGLGACIVIACLCPTSVAWGQACWKRSVSVHWDGVPLRDALARLAEAHRFGFLLDRRVDPGTPVFLEARNETLGTLLRRLADATEHIGMTELNETEPVAGETDSENVAKLGVCFLGENLYLGPRESAERLPALLELLRQQVDALPNRQGRRLLKESTLRMPMLSDPRRILEQAAQEAGFSWSELDAAVPHDLWDRTELLSLPLYRHLALVLLGFDRVPDFSEAPSGRLGTLSVSDIVESGKLPKNPGTSPENPLAETAVSGHNNLNPGRDRTETPSAGPKEAKEIKEGREDAQRSAVPLHRMRFTLTIRNQALGPLLEILADRAGLTLEIDRAALEKRGVSLESRVSFEVKEATATELFRAATQPVGANFRIRGSTLLIR